jgi:hypothetical protein
VSPLTLSARERERVRGGAELGLAAGTLGTGFAIGPLEERHNRHVAATRDARVAQLNASHGIDARGNLITTDRYAGLRNPHGRVPGLPAEVKRRMREETRRKHGAIAEANRQAKRRTIKPAGRLGRRWIAAGLATPLAWHGARSQVGKRVERRDVDAAALGALGGIGVHQGVHYAALPLDRHNERRIADDEWHRQVLREHRKTSGLPKNARLGDPRWQGYFRGYPTSLPGGRIKRAFSWTHGGRTGAAAVLGSGGLGGAYAVRTARRRREPVNKVVAEAAAAGLLAYGVPRVRSLGPALQRGIRTRTGAAREAAITAEAARLLVEHGTKNFGAYVRSSRSLSRAIDTVPPHLRGDVAAVLGTVALGQAQRRVAEHRQQSRGETVWGW